MDLQRAVSTLGTLGIDHLVLASGSDGAVLVVPEWGRVLGLWPHRRTDSVLWLDPELLSEIAGGARLEEWTDPGGDRLWLWPDQDFLDPDTGAPPAAVEPGRYAATTERAGACRMEARGDILALSASVRFGFRIARTIRPLGAEELAARFTGLTLHGAGYEESDSLEVSAGAPLAGLRGISRVRAVGQAWIGLRPRGVEEPSRLADCAVVHLGLGRRDVAFPANAARPLLLHLQDLGNGRWLLAVRECDWEREAGCTIGCAAAEGAPFADLAMRSPCVGGSTGLRALSWRQGLAAFIGRETEVKAFARTLVSGNGG